MCDAEIVFKEKLSMKIYSILLNDFHKKKILKFIKHALINFCMFDICKAFGYGEENKFLWNLLRYLLPLFV